MYFTMLEPGTVFHPEKSFKKRRKRGSRGQTESRDTCKKESWINTPLNHAVDVTQDAILLVRADQAAG